MQEWTGGSEDRRGSEQEWVRIGVGECAKIAGRMTKARIFLCQLPSNQDIYALRSDEWMPYTVPILPPADIRQRGGKRQRNRWYVSMFPFSTPWHSLPHSTAAQSCHLYFQTQLATEFKTCETTIFYLAQNLPPVKEQSYWGDGKNSWSENKKDLAKILTTHLCWTNKFCRKALTSSFVPMVIELSSKPIFLSILLNASWRY